MESFRPVAISFTHFLPLFSVKHLDRSLRADGSAASDSIQLVTHSYQSMSVSVGDRIGFNALRLFAKLTVHGS